MSFLPGMYPGLLTAGTSEFDLTFVGSLLTRFSNSIDISAITPGSIAAGDLCLVYQWANGSSPIDGTPSGFTELIYRENVAEETSIKVSAKKLTGSETTVTGFNSATNNSMGVVVVRPDSSFSSFSLRSSNSTITTSNPTAQTITSGTTPSFPVLAFGLMASTETIGGITTRSISPTMDEVGATGGGLPQIYIHYKIYNPGDTPSNHSYDMGDEGAGNSMLSGYLVFA